MIKLEHTEVMGWEHAIRGMRNPLNSWKRSDSYRACSYAPSDDSHCDNCDSPFCTGYGVLQLGPNDHDLMRRLAKGGPVHAKYRRMLTVYVDITAPLYWWKEFDTYKVGTVANSCSTMHKIAAKEFTLADFSCENLIREPFDGAHSGFSEMTVETGGPVYWCAPEDILRLIIDNLNANRNAYLKASKAVMRPDLTEEEREHFRGMQKVYWWQMIQLLPSSYNQKRTVMLNYEVLAGIYPFRKDHKLDEWHTFCDWIEKLPYSELVTGVQCVQGAQEE